MVSKDIGFGTELVDGDGYPLHDVDSVYRWIRMSRSRPRDPNVLYAMYWLHSNHYMIRWSMTEAWKYFDRAAEAGNPYAQYELGLMYRNGTKPKIRNYAKAAEWLGRSAGRGNVRAMKDLGEMYLEITADRDRFAKSAKWYCRAAAEGDDESVERMADMLRRNDLERGDLERILRENIRPEKECRILERVDELLESAPPAPRELKGLPQELIDLLTVPVPPHIPPAEEPPGTASPDIASLEAGAEEGSADAMFELGIMYRDGNGVSRDTATALSYFERAADLGHIRAHTEAGRIISVSGVEGCMEKALMHYSYGVEAGDRDSVSALKSASFYYPRNTTALDQYCAVHGMPKKDVDPSVLEGYELLDAETVVDAFIRSRKGSRVPEV